MSKVIYQQIIVFFTSMAAGFVFGAIFDSHNYARAAGCASFWGILVLVTSLYYVYKRRGA